jgi:hypothetical protein
MTNINYIMEGCIKPDHFLLLFHHHLFLLSLYVVRLSMICQQSGHEKKKKRIRIKKVAILLSVCMLTVNHLGASIVN